MRRLGDRRDDIRPRTAGALLSVDELCVAFPAQDRWVEVVHRARFDVRRGETIGLVGESGSGKTVTSLAVMGLVRTLGGRITGGTITFDGTDITHLPEREWLRLRGSRIAMIFQQPTRSLDPSFTIGDQIAEAVRAHRNVSRRTAWSMAVKMLDRVHIANAERRAHEYPHMFSGGMCQRAMIAMALVCEPELLVADEPTTALDVTIQSKFLDLLRELRDEFGLSVLYITHDLGVVASVCDRVAVMYAGDIVEISAIDQLFKEPRHPYTQGMLDSLPRRGRGKRMVAIPGQVPAPRAMPEGCRFHPRCSHAEEACTGEEPLLVEVAPGRWSRCRRADAITLSGLGGD